MIGRDVRELDFGQSRRGEAQLALMSVLGRIEKQPYAGSRLPEGEVLVEFDSAEQAAAYYAVALVEHLQGLGAEILYADAGGAAMGNYAPFETLLIHGSVPGSALQHGRKAAAQVVEAAAEVVRVLLATAVVAAAEECEDDEGVVVLFRCAPELGAKVDFETLKSTGLCRVRCLVHCSREPRVSYLLGSSYGMPKGPQIAYEFPLVEQIYGPNRLRWLDLRSPGYDPLPKAQQPALVVPP